MPELAESAPADAQAHLRRPALCRAASASPATTALIEADDRSISPTSHELPLVATNEAFFPARDDYEAHDALIAIAEGSVVAADDRRRLSPDNFLKSQAEMAALFADLPEAIDNTVEIARRCSYYPKNRNPILPRFTGGDVDDADGGGAAPRPQELRAPGACRAGTRASRRFGTDAGLHAPSSIASGSISSSASSSG